MFAAAGFFCSWLVGFAEDKLVGRRAATRHVLNNPHLFSFSAVRQRFPKIVRLDGLDLPPQYGFGLDNETTLTPSQGSFFANDVARNIAPEFLKQYYGIYDSDDRQPLLDAYHEQAMFSLTTLSPGKGSSWKANTLVAYNNDNRNLLSSTLVPRRLKLLRQGKLAVVSFLSELPKTQHDPNSFTIDVAHTSNTLMSMSCTGVFKEVNSKQNNPPIRAFSRVFMLVPQGAGYCIVNDMLFITNATADQAKSAFKVPAPTPSPSPVPPPVAVVPLVLTLEQQQQMVLAFSMQSGMNGEWSMKCLKECDWDFDKAATVFQEFNKTGKIPPQAFEK